MMTRPSPDRQWQPWSVAVTKASLFHTISDLNPYSLISNDTFGIFLTHINYAKQITINGWMPSRSPEGIQKECFIDGILKHPNPTSADFKDWGTMNSLIVSWIFATLDPSFVPSVPYKNKEKTLWDWLKNHFFADNGPKFMNSKGTLENCKRHGPQLFWATLILWDKLEAYEQVSERNCCTRQNCTWITDTERQKEEENFLLGLDSSFRTVISQIIDMKHLPYVNNSYEIITREELPHDITRGQDTRSEGVTFATRNMEKSSILFRYVTNQVILHPSVFILLVSQTGGKNLKLVKRFLYRRRTRKSVESKFQKVREPCYW